MSANNWFVKLLGRALQILETKVYKASIKFEEVVMAVARITEVIGGSEKSWDDAVNNALERANKTLRGLTGIEVTPTPPAPDTLVWVGRRSGKPPA